MDRAIYSDESFERSPRPLPLVALILLLAASGAGLFAMAGPPHLPARIPSWAEVFIVLQGSDVPLEWFAYAFTTAAWVLWIWIVGSLALRLVAAAAEVVTRGAAWARGLRAATDRFTLPIVRRVVDGAVVAVVVVNLVARAPAASAAPLSTPSALVAAAPPLRANSPAGRPVTPKLASSREAEYTVQSGDTLWSISERFYGTGEEFPRLVDANAGRRMPDGLVFTRAGVIQPGWVLRVPLPSSATQTEGGKTYYVVEKGDTLRGIAARFLGNENRWPEIFDLNRGQARLPSGQTLRNPDLIWPGLRLRLPSAPAHPAPLSPVPASPSATSSTSVAHPEPDRRSPPPKLVGLPMPVPRITVATPKPAVPKPATTPAGSATPPSSTRRQAHAPQPSSEVIYAAAGIAGLTIVGAAAVARRRFRRSLDEPADESTPPPEVLCNDFVEADLARPLAHRLQTSAIEPVEAVAASALRFLDEQGEDGASLILARQTRNATSLLLELDRRDEPWLDELASGLGSRLGGHGFATTTRDGDVLLKLAGLKLANLVDVSPDDLADRPSLVPIGVGAGNETVYLNWTDVGHALVTGQPGGGREIVLTTVLASLAARSRPDELRLLTLAHSHGLPDAMMAFPHQVRGAVKLESPSDVAAALGEVRAELLRRIAADDDENADEAPQPPRLIVVIEEIADVEDDGTTLELLGTHGPIHGIQLLAATSRASEVPEDLLVHFGTRLVLQALDDADSIRILGRPDAADLGGAELYLRVGGRTPIRLRGFRVADAHLDKLVEQMREVYGSSVATNASIPSRSSSNDDDAPTSHDSIGAIDDADRGDEERATENVVDVNEMASHVGATELVDATCTNELAVPSSANGNGYHRDILSLRESAAIYATNGHSEPDSVPTNGGARTVSLPGDNPTTRGPDAEPNESSLPSTTSAVDETAPDTADLEVAELDRPIRVRCFGQFVVTSGDRVLQPIGKEGTSYRAWELLALLASRPDGSLKREQILAALWPAAEEDASFAGVQKAASRVRDILMDQVPALPKDVLLGDRDGTYRVNPELVWTDARAFASLYAAAPNLTRDEAIAALQRLRRLYRGELLADQSYAWITRRQAGLIPRLHYADLYRKATCRLARLLCEDGEPLRAVGLYKSLLKNEPTLQDVVRGLFRCYQQLGDLGSLIREERDLRQALREALGDAADASAGDPSAETTSLFRQIRAELEGRAPPARRAPLVGQFGKKLDGKRVRA